MPPFQESLTLKTTYIYRYLLHQVPYSEIGARLTRRSLGVHIGYSHLISVNKSSSYTQRVAVQLDPGGSRYSSGGAVQVSPIGT